MRSAINFIKENLNGELVGVEIGVLRGENAEDILQNLQIKKLYLVDPYEEDHIHRGMSLKQAEDIADKKLSKYGDKIHIIKLKASDAVHLIPDNLDFIYIDGSHRYEYVKQDIENYYPKLKVGGILSGHDYNAREPGVNKAVNEFAKEKGLKLYVKPYDWWVIKC